MKIGIDISQTAFKDTGVANYLKNFVAHLISIDKENEYVLFYSSFRRGFQNSSLKILKSNPKIRIKEFKIPPVVLDFIWNRLHIAPVEWFVGDVDLFITSDWTEPPVKNARKATIIYDLVVYKFPGETSGNIIRTQRRKLRWVKKETDLVFCISEATKKDAEEVLNLPAEKLHVVYPGV